MTLDFDARSLKCPLLFVKTKQMLKQIKPGQQLRVMLNDAIGINDIKRYLDKQNFRYTLIELNTVEPSNVDQAVDKARTQPITPDMQFCIQAKET
ncbi:MAG: TusA-related sulfurtransferase [Phenylobacterium sp.]|jgi:TusA-related sulfurtransferase